MTEISLYNTRTRSKERFVPIDRDNVRMYVCGPTVYDRAHIGNARPVVVFDVLYRLLRHEFGPEHVTYVRNVTDVDDKINARAAAEKRPIRELTDETIGWYHADMGALGVLAPDHEPRATEYIPQMVAMIETLIARGHAYAAEGHVLFSVASYPEYGRFANRSLDEMQAGARVEVAPYKRDPMDFVLWKPSNAAEPGWPSPWGHGRPGWHIECSAMSEALLGTSFDIHGGGIDLVFPHHENEIAQSRCAHPEGEFARVWLHNGFLNVEGEKMSKSLGNFFTVRDLLDQGVPGEVIRLVLLSTHYRQPMDWTARRVDQEKDRLLNWRSSLATLRRDFLADGLRGQVGPEFLLQMANDINVPGAMAVASRYSTEAQKGSIEAGKLLVGAMRLLGLDPNANGVLELLIKQREGGVESVLLAREYGETINTILEKRSRARSDRDFGLADRLRDALSDSGVTITDTADGSTWSIGGRFDPKKLEAIQ